MGDDMIPRAESAMQRLYDRARTLSHPDGDSDKAEIMLTLALILEMQRALALEQGRILQSLDR